MSYKTELQNGVKNYDAKNWVNSKKKFLVIFRDTRLVEILVLGKSFRVGYSSSPRTNVPLAKKLILLILFNISRGVLTRFDNKWIKTVSNFEYSKIFGFMDFWLARNIWYDMRSVHTLKIIVKVHVNCKPEMQMFFASLPLNEVKRLFETYWQQTKSHISYLKF